MDKTVLVTGATSGIGRSLTLRLAALGADIAFCGRSQDKMNILLKEIESAGSQGRLHYSAFDITDEARVVEFVRGVVDTFGHIDVLVNCAGVNSARADVEDLDVNDLYWMLKVNLIAPVIFMREVYRVMKISGKGLMINIMSTVCRFSNEGIGAYTASKTGFDGITGVFRKESRKNNIKVCAVYPGGVNTPFREKERIDYLSPDDVADAIISVITAKEDVAIDEIVLRPFVETNFC